MNSTIQQPGQRAFCDLPAIVLDRLDPSPESGGRRLGMKQAKPSADDFEELLNLLCGIEEYFEFNTVSALDPQYDGESVSDERFMELLHRQWEKTDCRWRRVFHAAQMLVDAVCDPESGIVDFSPELQSLVDQHNAVVEVMP